MSLLSLLLLCTCHEALGDLMCLLVVEVSGDQKEAGRCRLHRLWWRGHLQHLILVDSKGLAGVSMAWIWHGYGTDMAWIWHGYGTDMAWIWHGVLASAGLIFFPVAAVVGFSTRRMLITLMFFQLLLKNQGLFFQFPIFS